MSHLFIVYPLLESLVINLSLGKSGGDDFKICVNKLSYLATGDRIIRR
ncbi:MAG TPA: hypothetical protein VK203_28845 [Nostocaceae cyanobacterium]|nr:hypothetical protein [Nostocaceae cyanobacterium]